MPTEDTAKTESKYKQRTFWFAIVLEAAWLAVCLYSKVDPQAWLENAMYIGAGWGVLDVAGNKLLKK